MFPQEPTFEGTMETNDVEAPTEKAVVLHEVGMHGRQIVVPWKRNFSTGKCRKIPWEVWSGFKLKMHEQNLQCSKLHLVTGTDSTI